MERIICPKCNRVVRNLRTYHYCTSKEIDDLFIGKPDEILFLFLALSERLQTLEDVEVSATKNCIVFVRNKTFLVVKPMLKCLQVKGYAAHFIEDETLFQIRELGKKYEFIFRYQERGELQLDHFDYFFKSYQIS